MIIVVNSIERKCNRISRHTNSLKWEAPPSSPKQHTDHKQRSRGCQLGGGWRAEGGGWRGAVWRGRERSPARRSSPAAASLESRGCSPVRPAPGCLPAPSEHTRAITERRVTEHRVTEHRMSSVALRVERYRTPLGRFHHKNDWVCVQRRVVWEETKGTVGDRTGLDQGKQIFKVACVSSQRIVSTITDFREAHTGGRVHKPAGAGSYHVQHLHNQRTGKGGREKGVGGLPSPKLGQAYPHTSSTKVNGEVEGRRQERQTGQGHALWQSRGCSGGGR